MWFAAIVLVAAALTLLAAWQGRSYWEYSDGVYSLSARQVLHGLVPYRDFAAAQPPPVYYLGAAALALDDSPAAIRIAMALCAAATSILVLVAVRRLTGSRPAAVAAAVASLFTPWQLREHAQLIPETIAAPLVLGAAILAARRTTAVLAGVLAALAAACKLAFLLPALAIAAASRAPRRSLAGLVLVGAAAGAAFLALFGGPLWTDAVHAQTQTGRASLRYVAGLWLQAAWNLAPLVGLAGAAWPRRDAIADPALARSLAAAAAGSLLLLATLLKQGSYLTVLVVAEPPLLCLAASGLVLTWRRQRGRAPAQRGLALAAVALLAAQAASLIVSPADPIAFTRPFAASGPAEVSSSRAVRAAAAAIRRCPRGTVYAGPPYLAFVAGRGIAGSQPDQFIIAHASVLARFRAAADRDPRICRPAPGPGSAASATLAGHPPRPPITREESPDAAL